MRIRAVWTRGSYHFKGCRFPLLLALSLAITAHAQRNEALEKILLVDVSAQKVSTALIELSKEAGIQLLMPGKSLDNFATPGVHGRMPLREALAELLRGTRYGFHQVGENTIGIDAP